MEPRGVSTGPIQMSNEDLIQVLSDEVDWRTEERERAFKLLGADDYPNGDLCDWIREIQVARDDLDNRRMAAMHALRRADIPHDSNAWVAKALEILESAEKAREE